MTDKLLIEALERGKFEAWYSKRYGYDFQAKQETWRHAAMCDAWETWQACHRSQQEAAQEPVAVVESIGGPKSLPQLLWYVGFPRIGVMVKPGDKLYTASPAAARKPLSVETIGRLVSASEVHEYHPGAIVEFVRSVESMHGITDAALSASGQKGEPT